MHVVRLILDLNSVFTRVDLPSPLSPSVCVCVCVCVCVYVCVLQRNSNLYSIKFLHTVGTTITVIPGTLPGQAISPLSSMHSKPY